MSVAALYEAMMHAVDEGLVLDRAMVDRIWDRNYMPVSSRVRAHIEALPGPKRGLANDNISDVLAKMNVRPHDLEEEIAEAHAELLHAMCIVHEYDHNSKETPERVAKMLVHETQRGRYYPMDPVTEFPNVKNADNLQVQTNIQVESMCSHHHQNIRGVAHIGILYHREGKVIGLSKLARIVRWYARRPQIQEELTVQIADKLMEILKPRGVVVKIEAEHQCMSVRGVCEPNAITSTIHLLGDMRTEPELRNEFYQNIPAARARG